MFQKSGFALAAALGVALTAVSAQASTVDVTRQSSNTFGSDNWRVVTSFAVETDRGTVSRNTYAGLFQLTATDEAGMSTDFLAVCLEPLANLSLPRSHRIGSDLDASVLDDLYALASNAQVNNSQTAAAFQMAAWELTTDQGDYDVSSGIFRITSNRSSSNAAETLAQSWLSNIQSNTWGSDGNEFQIFSAEGTQDLLTNLPAVPLPASGLLLGGALLGLGAARRKSRRQ